MEAPVPKLLEIASLPEGDGDMDAPKMDLKLGMDKKLTMETPVEKPEGSMTSPVVLAGLEPKLAFLPRISNPALVSLGSGWR